MLIIKCSYHQVHKAYVSILAAPEATAHLEEDEAQKGHLPGLYAN